MWGSECVLKVHLAVFADGLDVACETMIGVTRVTLQFRS